MRLRRENGIWELFLPGVRMTSCTNMKSSVLRQYR